MPRLGSRVRISFPAPIISCQGPGHYRGSCSRGNARALWLSGRVVMQRPAKPCTSVRFRAQPPNFSSTYQAGPCKIPPRGICPGGEIGRRKGLKIPRWQHRAGSSPAPGTIIKQYLSGCSSGWQSDLGYFGFASSMFATPVLRRVRAACRI